MSEQKIIILPDDSTAASIQTVTGWVSRLGHFFGSGQQSESMARYDGSTHRKCDCGEIIDRNGYCRKCAGRREDEKFAKMEHRPWNGTDALYSQALDRYFFDESELDDYCEDQEATPESLQLIICEPKKAYKIDPMDIYKDIMPDERDDLPTDIQDAFDELNRAIDESTSVISWFPGKYAAEIGGAL